MKPNFNEATGNNGKINIYNSLLSIIIRLKVVLVKILYKDITTVYQWKLLSDTPLIHTKLFIVFKYILIDHICY